MTARAHPLTHSALDGPDQPVSLTPSAPISSLMPAADLRLAVIRPTLAYLGVVCASTEDLILGTLLATASLGADKRPADGIGPYAISPSLHTAVWDDYLASQPELASLVRGLASQRCFLMNPHAELGYNLAYATAIAWLVYQHQALRLDDSANLAGLARLWQVAYPHQGGRASDFLNAWSRAGAGSSAISG